MPSTISNQDWLQANIAHDQMQANLLHLSSRSRRIIVKGSGHYIHFQRPDLLTSEATHFIQQIRSGGAMSESGTTVSE